MDEATIPFPNLEDVVTRARRGDRDALPELRELLRRHPDVVEKVGDLAQHAQQAWLEVLTKRDHDGTTDLVAQEAISQRAERLRCEIAGQNPTALESLVVSRIVLCWMQIHHADVAAAAAAIATPRVLETIVRRQERLARILKSSIDQLAHLRRLPATALRLVTDAA